MNINELADLLGVDLIVRRYPNQHERWTASFEKCETKDGGMLASEYGNGTSPELAIKNYCELISGKVLVFNAMSENRREFNCPKLTYENSTKK